MSARALRELRILLLGFGEVGSTLAEDLRERGCERLIAWDRLFTDASSGPAQAAARLGGSLAARNIGEAVRGAELIVSAVTAGECVSAARQVAGQGPFGGWYFDLNSVSPRSKQLAAEAIGSAGGRYVEAAVMSPISPKRIESPMLLGGPHAEDFAPLAASMGFTGAKVYSATYGRACAAKMCRSVVIKGLEALFTESLLAARRHGVEATVLGSLEDLLPGADARRLAQYMIGRSLQHGRRRAEEMREAANTVAEAGLTPWMSSACAERQDFAAQHADALCETTLETMLDAVLARTPAAERS